MRGAGLPFYPFVDLLICFCTFVRWPFQYFAYIHDGSLYMRLDSSHLLSAIITALLYCFYYGFRIAVLSTVRWCYTWSAACRPCEFTIVLVAVFELGIRVCMRSIQTGHVCFSGEIRHLENIWGFPILDFKKKFTRIFISSVCKTLTVLSCERWLTSLFNRLCQWRRDPFQGRSDSGRDNKSLKYLFS